MLLVAQQPTVTDIFPDREIINADTNTSIELTFDVDIDMATINMETFQIMGKWSGPSAGTREIVGGNTIKFTPDEPFFRWRNGDGKYDEIHCWNRRRIC